MKAQVSWAVLLMCLGCAQSAAVAQKTPAQRTVAVVVVDGHTEPAQPVPVVRVVLSFLYNSVRVNGVRGVTNPKGQTWLDVPEDAAQGGGLRIEIDGANNLVIYQPADGQLSALPATINVSLLPKGSSALLGPAQIEAMLHRTLVQVSSLQKQVTALKQNAAAEQSQKPDLGASIAEWAQANGFSAAEADHQVQQWAEGIQKQSGQATAEQKALSELALKHYADAARMFNAAGDADRQEINAEDAQEQALEAQVKALQAAQQALLDKLRTPLRQLLDDREQAAGAYRLNLQYTRATQTLESAEATADAECKKHPEDKGFHELWLQAVWDTAGARWREGEIAPASESLALLAQSADDYASLAREYAALGNREAAAAAHAGLGIALVEEGERVSEDKAAALFDQAVQAYRSALEVYTKADLPQHWAETQNDLGNAFLEEGDLASGNKAAGMLDQAVQAYRGALEVYTKADLPQDWAMTENNLGLALMHEGEGASGEKAAGLLDQAVRAYHSALEVYTKADMPQAWASTQNNLGTALMDEEDWASGDKAAALLDEAVEAYRSALGVRTKADLPQEWAATQMNLGLALEQEGERAGGDKAAALFDQAEQAYRSALEVYTRADLPGKWAATQMNLMELNLWAGRFTDCFQQAAVLDDEALPPAGLAIRNAMKLACQWGTGDRGAAATTETALASKPPVFQSDFWDFTGTIDFISHSPAFEKGRASWIALFTAMQNSDAAGMTAALHQLEPLLQQ
jgi:tetratricopeptide (TPR) repeat protein